MKKAAEELDGQQFHLGLSEDPAHSDKPYFIPRSRIEQAKRMIADGRAKGIQFVLPVDFVLQDGRVSDDHRAGQPAVRRRPRLQRAVRQHGQPLHRSGTAGDQPPAVVFHNGVFGMFEDPRFEEGTRKFVGQLKRMTDAGLKVYIGGGEGGTALEKYGQPDWVTYCFTAGGTVLERLGQRAGALPGGPEDGGGEIGAGEDRINHFRRRQGLQARRVGRAAPCAASSRAPPRKHVGQARSA